MFVMRLHQYAHHDLLGTLRRKFREAGVDQRIRVEQSRDPEAIAVSVEVDDGYEADCFDSEMLRQGVCQYAEAVAECRPRVQDRDYRVHMPDGSVWAVPVLLIAKDRAKHYAQRDGMSFQESMTEDTLPLFNADAFEVKDWAQNNMDWSDVQEMAQKVHHVEDPDQYQEGWMNGEVDIR